jgi:hypothetical protein
MEFTGYESAFIPTPPGTVSQDETPTQQTPAPERAVYGSTYAETLRRNIRKNPLAAYSSYTYQLSLYMITPDAYDVFVRNGRKDIEIVNQAGSGCDRGAYLIAQSGGINNTTTIRAPGFHYDYLIDDLVINAVVSPTGTSAPTTNAELTFTIYEQYGFSFISNLKRAKDELNLYSTTPNIRDATNASRQFFILGVQFLGYDENGNIFTGLENTFKRYYDILFTKIDFKIDGRATTYKITAVAIPPTIAFGQKRGVIDKGANQLIGSTVKELCDALCAKLNNDQNIQVPKDREFANKYTVDFSLAPEIGQSKIISTLDVDKIKWPMAVANNKTNINPGLEIKAQPNKDARIVAFNRDTPIIQAIQTIINQSNFLIDGLQLAYSTKPQPNKEGNREDIESNKRAKWFNISTVVSNAKWDTKLKDFAFDITYVVKTYETPFVLSVAADKTSEYYGPFKRYEYWLTGQNSEILRYEQTMNNAYFTVAIDTMGADSTTGNTATGGNANIPIGLNKRTPGQRINKLDLGMEAQNNYVTNLIDPGAYAKASVLILGDPDLLSNDMPTGNPELDKKNTPFYGPDGYSLDSRSGQTFIEIDFREAIDYDHSQGYMRVNDKILFWDYPPSVKKNIQGIVFYLTNVKSIFRAGKFTQDLDLTMATFGFTRDYGGSDQGREDARQQQYNDNEIARLQKRGNPPVGLREDSPPTGASSGGDPCGPAALPQQNNQQATSKGVADDDASSNSVIITGEANQDVNGNTINSLGAAP